MNLPDWAREIVSRYESGANNQFVLHGNVEDRFLLSDSQNLGTLGDFLARALLSRFDVVLSYDLGAGIRIDKGNQIFAQWPAFKANSNLPREARPALETLTHYARYCANLGRLGQNAPRNWWRRNRRPSTRRLARWLCCCANGASIRCFTKAHSLRF